MADRFPQRVFKITTVDAWSAAIVDGAFTGSPDDRRDGFIHLSANHQIAATAAKYFAGIEDLCLIAFDVSSLGEHLVWEASRGGELFPHYYAALPTVSALWIRPIFLDEDGTPLLGELDADSTPVAS